jgi:hypothetical protein
MRRVALGEIMLREPLPHFVSGYTHDRVLAAVKIRRKPEQFHSDRPLFEIRASPAKSALNNVLEELAAPPAGTKRSTFQYASELLPDGPDAGLVGSCPFAVGHAVLAYRS